MGESLVIGSRGQAPFDFLASYGWIVVLVVAVIIILPFFDGFNVFMPVGCSFNQWVLCEEFSADGENDRVELGVRNAYSQTLVDFEVGVVVKGEFCGEVYGGDGVSEPAGELSVGVVEKFVVDCSNLVELGVDDIKSGKPFIAHLEAKYRFKGQKALNTLEGKLLIVAE